MEKIRHDYVENDSNYGNFCSWERLKEVLPGICGLRDNETIVAVEAKSNGIVIIIDYTNK